MGSSTNLRSSKQLGFSAIPRARLYEEVIAQIRTMITEGQLQPGDKLPAERELVRRFQVSRSSVRDAIRALEMMGLVRCRQGEGTIVRDASADSLTVPLSSMFMRSMIAELLEARDLLEPPIAALAATHATPEQVEHMEDVLDRQRSKMKRQESSVDEDTEFHYAIAVAAQNSVLKKVVDLLISLLTESRSRSLDVVGRKERSYAGHRRILRAIKRHQPAEAEKAMRLHLRGIQSLLLRSL
jgi:GntR family transcriptional repressor for pyruvate dehydrogenase complex